MTAALNELVALAHIKMHPANLFVVKDIEMLVLSFKEETEKVLRNFSKELLSMNSEKKLELRIQQIQLFLISIADTIVLHQNSFLKSDLDKKQYDILYNSSLADLEYLLSYIETHYKQYFNLDQKVPDNYLAISRNNIKAGIKKVKSHFMQEGLDNQFIQVIFYPQLRLINNTNTNYTYRDLIYIKKLLAYQQEILSTSTQHLKQQLIESMFYFNCNCSKIYTYYINAVIEELETEQSFNQKVTILAKHSKNVNQLQQKPGYSFNAKALSIKEQVNIWLEEELIFIEKQMQMNPLFSIPHNPNIEEEGINVSLSVKELAVFTRLMMDSGIIYNNNKSYVTKKIASLFRVRDKQIQPHSLSRKIHLKEEHSMNKVKDYLIKMLNSVNKMLDE